MTTFLSCFSGIEAASVAWPEWRCVGVAEIEPFSCAVLAHHYPGVPNLGSVLADDFLDRAAALHPDVVVGGPPCQDFSVAGLRAGLAGDRGNLSLRWLEIIRATRPRFALTENVPGWLSVNGGRAFGAFLAGLVGHDTDLLPPANCGGRWTDSGMVDGPDGRCAWRILDAQFFGLAQRRRRVFVVFCPRDGADPAAVLFERQGLRWHPAPGREAGAGTAVGTLGGTSPGGGWRFGADEAAAGQLIPDVATTLRSRDAKGSPDSDCTSTLLAFGGNNTSGPIDVATAVNACHTASGRQDFETETFIAHTLRADGFDASEDGTGRGTPLVPVPFDTTQITSAANYSNPQPGDPCHPLAAGAHPPAVAFNWQGGGTQTTLGYDEKADTAGNLTANQTPAVAFQTSQSGTRLSDTHATLDANNGSRRHNGVLAFSCKDNGRDAQADVAPTLRAMNHLGSHANGGGQMAVASFQQNSMDGRGTLGYDPDTQVLRPVKPQADHQMLQMGAAVRRLTPEECEKLQGFPPGYTDIPWRGHDHAPDGPSYKALGNSFAVNVVRWIGRRVEVLS